LVGLAPAAPARAHAHRGAGPQTRSGYRWETRVTRWRRRQRTVPQSLSADGTARCHGSGSRREAGVQHAAAAERLGDRGRRASHYRRPHAQNLAICASQHAAASAARHSTAQSRLQLAQPRPSRTASSRRSRHAVPTTTEPSSAWDAAPSDRRACDAGSPARVAPRLLRAPVCSDIVRPERQ
jgi:hypothetical protein